jgi:hypothetical protein
MCKKHYKQEYYYTVFNWRVLQMSSAPIILTTGKGTNILLKYSDNIKDASHIISRLIFIAGNKIQLLRPIINIILMSSLKKWVRFRVTYVLRRGWQTYGMHTQSVMQKFFFEVYILCCPNISPSLSHFPPTNLCVLCRIHLYIPEGVQIVYDYHYYQFCE